ncbi:MAG: VirB3 family type IV secretion system protein [Deltaproteobacteria bacterium]|nr:VirB3 family type IV secretion system protein [Deltaproteobacteria bacterium]
MKRENINYPFLWRPIAIKGVPRDFVLFLILLFGLSNAIFALLGFGNIFWGLGVVIIGFIFGYFRAKSDPEFFLVYLNKIFRIGKTKGKSKGNIYYA